MTTISSDVKRYIVPKNRAWEESSEEMPVLESEQLMVLASDYDALKTERDALAAHVERCRDVFFGLSEYWNGCEGMAAENAAQNAMDIACDMLEELP